MPRTRSESETLILTDTRPLALAHRGARLEAPENTISALELALEHGCDGFECDLRATADGEIVLCHDPTLCGAHVARSTYSELAAITAARNRESAPRLQDVLERFAGKAYMDLELKHTGMASRVSELLHGVDREKVLVSSFLPEALDEVRRHDASVTLGWISDDARRAKDWREVECGAVVLHYPIAKAELLRELHAAGKRILVWAAEQEHEIEQLVGAGVAGIISGHTRLLAQTLRQTKARAAVPGR